MHVEFLLEEESAQIAVNTLLCRLMPQPGYGTWRIQFFRGKQDLVRKLRPTLSSIAKARYADRVVIMLDADREDCLKLKQQIMREAESAGLSSASRSHPDATVRVRIAMTELESWYIGDPDALRAAYDRLTSSDLKLRQDVDALPDACEWLQKRLIKRHYYARRMPKKEVASLVSAQLSLAPDHNASRSFRLFLRTLRELFDLPDGIPTSETPSSRSPSR